MFCFLKEEKKLRGNKKYTTLDTRKDGVRFTSSALRQLNDQFRALKETYDDVQSKLANEVIKIASKIYTIFFLQDTYTHILKSHSLSGGSILASLVCHFVFE